MNMTINQLSKELHQRLKSPLPGQSAQQAAQVKSNVKFNFTHTIETAIPAGVLILLFPKNDDIHFFLTTRTDDVEHHKGQISLPGGVWEKDEQLHETAFRETEEEIGVSRNNIQLLGGLTPLFTPVTGFMIHPFIGWIDEKPTTIIQESEVKKLFSASIIDLINKNTFITENWSIRGYDATVPFFNLSGQKVWGATGAILSEFKSVLKEII